MEAAPQVPPKKLRSSTVNQANLSLVECIREFKLPQAYPSMVKYGKSLPLANVTVQKPKPITTEPSNIIQTTSTKDTSLSADFRKVKLVSPDGRHLGEFEVQIITSPNNNKQSKGVAISINKPTKQIDPANVIKSDEAVNGKTIRIAPGGVKNLSSAPAASQVSTSVRFLQKPTKIDVPERTQGVLIPISSNMISKTNFDNNQLPVEADNHQKSKMIVVQPAGNGWQVVKLADNDKNSDNVQTVNTLPMIMKPRANETELKGGTLDATNMSKIRNTVVKSVEVVSQGTKRKMDGAILGPIIKDKKLVNVGNSNIVMKLEGVNVNEQNNASEKMIYVLDEDSVSENDTNIFNTEPTPAIKKPQYLRNSHGTVNLIRRGRKDPANKLRSSSDPNPLTNDSPINSNSVSSNVQDEDDMSSKLSIVGQALSTIGDEELKAKALKALADCGIGIERFIPIKPPLNQMSIKESQTQTNVFGLLNKSSFINVDNDIEGLKYLSEIEKKNIFDDTEAVDKASKKALTEKFTRDLNKMLDSFWVNKSSVEQIRDMLKTNPIVEKAYNMLEKDFKNCKKYDKNGLLNIHRAVLMNQERLVKRQIMVLKSCKENIDLPTSNGETSLELAVRYDISPTIIMMLLTAGASPTASESAHDSALTLASKQSSPILTQFIKYLSPTDPAINNVDSEGFTALHYCAMNGNDDAVSDLIRVNVDLNARDCKSGRTALFHALENEYLSICKELLANGAKGNIPNFAGQTVFTLFDEDKHYTLKEALQRSMK